MRTLAAVLGGYALTSLVTLAVPLLLAEFGISPAQTLLATTMASFFVYAAIIMAVFHARSVARASRWLVAGLLSAGLIVLLLAPGFPE